MLFKKPQYVEMKNATYTFLKKIFYWFRKKSAESIIQYVSAILEA